MSMATLWLAVLLLFWHPVIRLAALEAKSLSVPFSICSPSCGFRFPEFLASNVDFTYCHQVFISFECITPSYPSSCIQIEEPQLLHSFPPRQLLCLFTPLIVSFSFFYLFEFSSALLACHSCLHILALTTVEVQVFT